jgi:hypothetical protein
VLLSNVLVKLEKDGLASSDQTGQIHDLIRKAVVAKHGRQYFDSMMGEALSAYNVPISSPRRRGTATKQRRLDAVDLTSVGIAAANQSEVAARLNNILAALDMEVIVVDAAAAVAAEPEINKLPKLKPVSDAIQMVAYNNIISFKEAGELLSNVLSTLSKKGYKLDKIFEELQLGEGIRDAFKRVFKGVSPIQEPRTAKSTAGVKRTAPQASVVAQKVTQQDTSKLKKAQDQINKLLAPFDVMVKLVSTQSPKGASAPGPEDMMRSADDVAPMLENDCPEGTKKAPDGKCYPASPTDMSRPTGQTPLEESYKRMSKLAGIVKG